MTMRAMTFRHGSFRSIDDSTLTFYIAMRLGCAGPQGECEHMKIMIATVAMFLANVVLAQAPPLLPCKNGHVKCALEARDKSPVRNKSFWAAALAKPVEQRVGVAPEELLVYLNLDNIVMGVPKVPRAVEVSADFLKDVNDAFAELPAVVKNLIGKKLAGIYFVKDLGGTGFAIHVQGGWFSSDAGIIVLDVNVLERQTANAWATWKENMPFRADPSHELDAQIENAAGDNRKNAIQYILLHEMGHIIAIGEKIHPRWDGPASNVDGFPFAKSSWRLVPEFGRYESTFEKQFGLRQKVVYYTGAQLNASQMRETYSQLATTNFPTLYAATRPDDDFAESFVSYVHSVVMKRPWEISLYADGKLVKSYKSCWEEKRCAEKRRILEETLGIRK